MIRTLLPKLFFIVYCSLTSYHLIADEKTTPATPQKKTVLDVFRGSSTEELTFAEDDFSFPDLNAQTKWVAFDAGIHSRNNRFYLAIDSLTQGKNDRIFRYAVKFITPGGAENIRFEGLECLLKVYKVYAFGNPEGTWTKASSPHWQDIVRHVRNGYQAELYDTLCKNSERLSIEEHRRKFEEGARLVEG